MACLASVRRHRVQMFIRTISPFLKTVCLWTFGLKVRFVLGARRNHLPPWLYCMLRPNCVVLPHSSHFAKVAPPFVSTYSIEYYGRNEGLQATALVSPGAIFDFRVLPGHDDPGPSTATMEWPSKSAPYACNGPPSLAQAAEVGQIAACTRRR